MNGTRSKLMLVAVVLAMSAYLPACCCWMETVSAWMMGAGDRSGSHACCGHHEGGGLGESGPCGDDEHGAGSSDGRQGPKHLTECGCGVQYRIGVQAQPTLLDFAPAVLMWAGMPMRMGEGARVVVAARPHEWSGCETRGERTLLRLHCELTV